MNALELEELVKKDKLISNIFLGIFPCNLLPNKLSSKPCAVIVNTHPDHKPGEHWLAIHFDVMGKCELFDSYGITPIPVEIDHFIKNQSKSVNINRRWLQSADTAVCGMYCIYYLHFKCRGLSYTSIFSKFDRNLSKNDAKICNFISQKFNFTHKICCTNEKIQKCVSYCARFSNV